MKEATKVITETMLQSCVQITCRKIAGLLLSAMLADVLCFSSGLQVQAGMSGSVGEIKEYFQLGSLGSAGPSGRSSSLWAVLNVAPACPDLLIFFSKETEIWSF